MASVYGDRWRVQESLGSGGQGEVFKVEDLVGEYPLSALKRVRNPKRRERFHREIAAMRRLSHPNIMRVIDHSPADSDPMYLVMPLAQGGDLADRVGVYKDSIDSSLIVATALAVALESAHGQSIVHRDVKPANILFERTDNVPILSDFGIALLADDTRVTEAAEAVGPRSFMAPEQEGGGQVEVSPSVDLYALGKTIYFMLSGGVILAREGHRQARYDIFTGRSMRHLLLGNLLDKLITSVDRRLSSASAVREELNKIMSWAPAPISTPMVQQAHQKFLEKDAAARARAQQEQDLRLQRDAVMARCAQSFVPWLEGELKTLRDSLHVDGQLHCALRPLPVPDDLRFKVPPSDDFAEAEAGIALVIERPRAGGKFDDGALCLYLCRLRARISKGDQVKALLVPIVRRAGSEGFLAAPRRDRQGREMKQSYLQLQKEFKGTAGSIGHLFSANEWPAAAADVQEVVSRAVAIYLSHLDTTMIGTE